MSELMRASRQWATRPAEERFWGLTDLAAAANAARTAAVQPEPQYKLCQLTAEPAGDDILIRSPKGAATPSNWGFAQLCHSIGAPPEYLMGQPAELACKNLNWGLQATDAEVKMLVQRQGNGGLLLRSVTSPDYTRYWDSDLCQLLRMVADAGWKIPPARPACHDPRNRPATQADLIPGMKGGAQVGVGDVITPSVYRGDRSSFLFWVNPDRPTDGDGGLFKGLIASNSEVGCGAIRFSAFDHEGVCGNHIIWGVENVCELRRVHKGNLQPFLRKLAVWLRDYTATDTQRADLIQAAKLRVLGQNVKEVTDTLYARRVADLTQKVIKAAYHVAEEWEHTAGATPNTVWGFVHGLTRYSQTLPYADARHKLDVAAGKVLSMAS